MIDTFSTDAANPPAAFNRLRADLHHAAGPYRIAANRAFRQARELMRRSDFFFEAAQVHAGTGLGDWYAKLATRLHEASMACKVDGWRIEDEADDAEGIVAGVLS